MSKMEPNIRFEGFVETWEQRKLDELGKITTGKAFSSTDFVENGEYLVITNKDISDSSRSQTVMNDQINIYDTELINMYVLSGKNILVTMDGVNLGKTAIYSNDKALLAQRVGRIQSEQFEFVYQVTKNSKFLATMRTLSVGNAIKHISLKQISEYTCFAPKNTLEQRKIGILLKRLDEIIALHQDKLDHLQRLKTALLQQLFPTKEETVPKLRFAHFEEEWEQRKLGEVAAATYGGGTPKTSIDEYWSGEFPWIQSSDLDIDVLTNIKPRKFISEKAIQNSSTKVVPANSIAIVTRVGVGKLALIPFNYSTSQDFLSLSNLNIDHQFGLYAFYKLLKKEQNNTQGTSIKGITKESLLNKVIDVPVEFDEQYKIGTFFKQLDDTIALHQKKLIALKKLRTALLQKMFI